DGVVIVVDPRGGEHREESGTLRPRFVVPPRKNVPEWLSKEFPLTIPADEVAVAAGRFHVEVPRDLLLGVEKVVLGGRLALFEGEPSRTTAGEPVTIRVRWVDAILLHVVDATSRVELDDVTVVRDREFATHSYPGVFDPAHTIADHVASPITVS